MDEMTGHSPQNISYLFLSQRQKGASTFLNSLFSYLFHIQYYDFWYIKNQNRWKIWRDIIWDFFLSWGWIKWSCSFILTSWLSYSSFSPHSLLLDISCFCLIKQLSLLHLFLRDSLTSLYLPYMYSCSNKYPETIKKEDHTSVLYGLDSSPEFEPVFKAVEYHTASLCIWSFHEVNCYY